MIQKMLTYIYRQMPDDIKMDIIRLIIAVIMEKHTYEDFTYYAGYHKCQDDFNQVMNKPQQPANATKLKIDPNDAVFYYPNKLGTS